jgi:hypothetical protein
MSANKGPNYLSKITTVTVGLSPKAMTAIATAEENAEKLPLTVMRVYGNVKSTVKAVSNFGETVGFIGEFEAINAIDQQVFRSKKLFLPEMGAMALSDALNAAKAKSPEAFVEFGYDIGVTKNTSSKNAGGGWQHQWVIIPLRNPNVDNQEDQLSRLGKSLGDVPALPAPKAASPKAKK